VAGKGARVGESFSAASASERLLARMDSQMFLQMMLEFERLPALLTLEPSHLWESVMRDHMALQSINIRK
jgi:hypothetical protein